jgi:hypothetical protein
MYQTSVYLTLTCLIFNFTTFGQLSQDDTILLLKSIKQISDLTPITYLDSSPFFSRDRLIKKIEAGKIENISNSVPDAIYLNKEEQELILTEFKTNTKWPDNILPNSRKINTDSIWTYLSKVNGNRTEKRNNGDKPISYEDLLIEYAYVYSIDKPIYIRNKTICLITVTAICGQNCGRTLSIFYKKENETWKGWIIVRTD